MSWGEAAQEHLAASKDPVRLQVFTNTVLGQTWELKEGVEIDGESLAARKEPEWSLLPAKVLVLTAGVDVQEDRFEMTVCGWGAGEECWVVDHRVIWGDPSSKDAWDDLETALWEYRPHTLTLPDLPIRAACVDTGGSHTMATYNWVRGKQANRIWAIKGRSNPGAALWPRAPTKANKGKIPLYVLNVDAGKEALYARLQNKEPGPGFIHLSETATPQYLAGLTSERYKTVYKKGFPHKEWILPSGHHNEPLDCWVYAYSALHGLRSMGLNLDTEAQKLARIPAKAAQPTRKSDAALGEVPPTHSLQPSGARRVRSRGLKYGY